MIKLDRSRVKILARWQAYVEAAFPDYKAFLAKAAAFEKLDCDDPVRRQGFKTYAPEVLPRKRGGCDFKAIWSKAKRAIAAMSHRKCAYCETRMTAERAAAVEHFKPKALFPSLVYEWSNYLLGCFGCNGAKSDKWPPAGGSYVRPDEDDPGPLFRFLEDGRVEAVEPAGAAAFTILDLELNREWLCEARAVELQKMIEDIESVLGDERVPEDVRKEIGRKYYARLHNPELAYSEALRQVFRRIWAARFPGVGLREPSPRHARQA